MNVTPEEVMKLAKTVHEKHMHHSRNNGNVYCRYCLCDLDVYPPQHKEDCVELIAKRIIEERLI